ncbi:uncharacterized protein LOC143464656 isoform X1 [Clavelina lepadiformis]|uniref:uncharacterized protein LOC143464656 isoform X1 n=1 Tax=Clavelina lepadiformis TaxID=159417 RepID=UPI0040416429
MSVKSRIPQGRPSKIPGFGGTSRLPFASGRSKYGGSKITMAMKNEPLSSNRNSTVVSAVSDNYKLTFVPPGTTDFYENLNDKVTCDTVNNISVMQNGSSITLQADGTCQEFEENCEVLSLCSTDPSPTKHSSNDNLMHQTDHNYNNLSSAKTVAALKDKILAAKNKWLNNNEVVHDYHPPLHVKDLLEDNHTDSGASSTGGSSKAGTSRIKKLKKSSHSTKSNTVKNFPPGNISKQPLTTTSAFVNECIGGGKLWKSTTSRTIVKQKKITLPQKLTTTVNPSSAMDCVASNTARASSRPLTRRRGSANLFSDAANETCQNARPSRKILAPNHSVMDKKSSGKWSSDIDSAMNLARRNSRKPVDDEIASNGSVDRADRKKSWRGSRQQMQLTPDGVENNSEETLHADDSLSTSLNENDLSGKSNGHKSSSETIKSANRSPRIARPVTRPPRRRGVQNDKPDSTDDPTTTPDQDTAGVKPADPEEESVVPALVHLSRRASVPAESANSPNGALPTRSRQRRRASEAVAHHRHQRMISGVSEESGYIANTASFLGSSGDSVAVEIACWQDRLHQNERYRQILENPDIVTFGQWRVKKEGNYAPEEKYGRTERRSIRSSSDSDSISPRRRLKTPVDDTADNQARISNDHAEVFSEFDKNPTTGTDLREVDDKTRTPENTLAEESMIDRTDQSLLTDLPSIDSTAMMVDYLTRSNISSPQDDEDALMTSMTGTSTETSNAVNKILNKGLNGVSERLASEVISRSNVGSPRSHSSPLQRRALDDINKLSEAIRASDDLATTIDDVLNEYKVVRLVLEKLYDTLSQDEDKMAKMSTENVKLRQKNDELTDEVNRITRLLEVQQASPIKRKTFKLTTTRNAEAQTDQNCQTWYRTELNSVGLDLNEAKSALQDLKINFEDNVKKAEDKLDSMLKEMKQT